MDFTADIVMVGGQACTKVDRELKPNLKLVKV